MRHLKRLGLVNGGGGGVSGKSLVDVCESWNGFHTVLSGNSNGQICDGRSEVDSLYGASTTVLFPQISGALAALTYDGTALRTIHPYASIAAISSLSGQGGAGNYSIPISPMIPGSALPLALWPRPLRRYRIDYLVRGTVGPGAADCACGLSATNPQGLVTGGIPDAFAAWVSRGAVNGGNWTPRFRTAGAGAVTNGPDSGVAFVEVPARYRMLSLVFEEGNPRRIRWLIDNREVHQITDALIPQSNGTPLFAKVMGAGAGVTVCHYAETRFRVDEI